jgi:P27 family predicted phage terminase small subunit
MQKKGQEKTLQLNFWIGKISIFRNIGRMMMINISNLDKSGKELYEHILQILKDNNRYVSGDEITIEQLCNFHQDYRWAVKEIKKRNIGRIMNYPNGTRNVSSEWTIKEKAAKNVSQLCRELWLSPNSRKQIISGDKPKKTGGKTPLSPLELRLENKKNA